MSNIDPEWCFQHKNARIEFSRNNTIIFLTCSTHQCDCTCLCLALSQANIDELFDCPSRRILDVVDSGVVYVVRPAASSLPHEWYVTMKQRRLYKQRSPEVRVFGLHWSSARTTIIIASRATRRLATVVHEITRASYASWGYSADPHAILVSLSRLTSVNTRAATDTRHDREYAAHAMASTPARSVSVFSNGEVDVMRTGMRSGAKRAAIAHGG